MTGSSATPVRAIEPVNDTHILEKLRAFHARVDRMESQRERLTRSHPDHWVALHTREFVLAESLDNLLKTLRRPRRARLRSRHPVPRFESEEHDPLTS